MDEGQFLQNVYAPSGTKRKLWPIRYLRHVFPGWVTRRGYGGPGRFGFDPGSWLTETSPLATSANAESILDAWKPYWELDRRLLLEKSPPNMLRTRFLQELFPDSYFIVLMRHPIPISYATRRWTKMRPLYYLFKHWTVCYERFIRDRPHLAQVFTMYYEDFVKAPQQSLDELFAFLQLPSAPLQRDVSPSVNHSYFERWEREVRTGNLRSWYVDLLRSEFEEKFNRFGYTLDGPWQGDPDDGRYRSDHA